MRVKIDYDNGGGASKCYKNNDVKFFKYFIASARKILLLQQ